MMRLRRWWSGPAWSTVVAALLGLAAWQPVRQPAPEREAPPTVRSATARPEPATGSAAAAAEPSRPGRAWAVGTPEQPSGPPAASLDEARALETEGRFASAMRLYRALAFDGGGAEQPAPGAPGAGRSATATPPGPDGRLRAAVALARLELDAGRGDEALAVLERVMATYSAPSVPPEAQYYLGEALESAQRFEEAAAAYGGYGLAMPEMSDVAAMAEGKAWFAARRYAEAALAFQRSLERAGNEGVAFLAQLRLGNALLRTGPPGRAGAAYRAAFERAGDDDQRAQALAGLIAVHEAVGDTEAATAARRRIVLELPSAKLAETALAKLDAAGEPVSAVERAAVHAAAGRHAEAVRLLRAAIRDRESRSGGSGTAPGAWRLALVRSLAALGDRAGVIEVCDELLAAQPGSGAAPDLAWARITSLVGLGRDQAAADSYREYATRWPADERAPTALWLRALILERLAGRVGRAAAGEALDELVRQYPASRRATEARFRAGLHWWRVGDVPKAAERWSALAESASAAGWERSRAAYWLGRMASETGNRAVAEQHWAVAARLDPAGFYGLRAARRLGRLPRPPSPSSPSAVEPAAAIGEWLSVWRPALTHERWREVMQTTSARGDVVRGAAWLSLGERRAAVAVLRRAARSAWDDPAVLAALALEAWRLGLPSVGISAADRLLALAPARERAAAPPQLYRLVYPDAYGRLVRAAASARGLSAALLFALIRQESRFEPSARSSAGAAGLAQVMPATFRHIAAQLGEEQLSSADLMRPHVSIRYGAWYLENQLQAFRHEQWAALAAYNAGPGNVRRWLSQAGNDVEVFVELIDFDETRAYVRLVSEQQVQYERWYPAAPRAKIEP